MDLFEGAITGVAFAGGDVAVVGTWARSPLGSFVDVMWRRADGVRVLLAPSDEVAAYVGGVYRFDEVAVVTISGGIRGDRFAVTAGPLVLDGVLGPRDWRSWLFALRPRVLRRSPGWIALEDRMARPLVSAVLGGGAAVRATGVTPGGQREFYGADDWRRVVRATLVVDGVDAGGLRPLPADVDFGVSAFPTVPASVRVGTLIEV